eukprot:TRINITY_DN4743_c0_g1_i1.p1 TRINITY_DN4743_c0_g1~~TRINITY_DN4743_c0_g1_i1.p1  ORF type:complete len:458 (-),score=93.97 TRINITY_DN4743_c0_g1_i1:63-1436(-)
MDRAHAGENVDDDADDAALIAEIERLKEEKAELARLREERERVAAAADAQRDAEEAERRMLEEERLELELLRQQRDALVQRQLREEAAAAAKREQALAELELRRLEEENRQQELELERMRLENKRDAEVEARYAAALANAQALDNEGCTADKDGRAVLDVRGPWRRVLDASSGDCYYWNKETKEVTWETPDAWKEREGGEGVDDAKRDEEAEKRKRFAEENRLRARKGTGGAPTPAAGTGAAVGAAGVAPHTMHDKAGKQSSGDTGAGEEEGCCGIYCCDLCDPRFKRRQQCCWVCANDRCAFWLRCMECCHVPHPDECKPSILMGCNFVHVNEDGSCTSIRDPEKHWYYMYGCFSYCCTQWTLGRWSNWYTRTLCCPVFCWLPCVALCWLLDALACFLISLPFLILGSPWLLGFLEVAIFCCPLWSLLGCLLLCLYLQKNPNQADEAKRDGQLQHV